MGSLWQSNLFSQYAPVPDDHVYADFIGNIVRITASFLAHILVVLEMSLPLYRDYSIHISGQSCSIT